MVTIMIEGVEYRLATLWQRLAGQIIDAIIYGVIVFISTVPLGLTWIGIILAGLYYFFQDGLRGGQSYGKRVMRTAVIDTGTGQWCSFGQAFVRNFLLAVLNFFDWIFIIGVRRQRLGDKLASTAVIQVD